jgi:hypothetical protein
VQALLAPRSTDKKIKFWDRQISVLIQTYGRSGALSFDNIMQIRFSRTVRNILGPGALVTSITLLFAYNSSIMNKSGAEIVGAVTDYSAEKISSITGNSSKATKLSGIMAPLTQLTIQHCAEKTLWYPILTAIAINAFAHGILVLQSRRVSAV